jgi:predicted Zn-dependent protease
MQPEVGVEQLPRWHSGMLAALDQGQHHPAVAALFAQAEQARQQRQWQRALTYLDQARQIQPRNAAILYRQAWVSLQLNEANRAEQLLRRALVFSQQPELSQRLRLLLAEALDAQGKSDAAEQQRRRVVSQS